MFGIEEFNIWSWWYALPYAVHIIIAISFLILLWLFFGLFRQVAKNLAVGMFYIGNLLQSILKILVLVALIGGMLLFAHQVYIDSGANLSHWGLPNAINVPPQPKQMPIEQVSEVPQLCASSLYIVTGLNGKALNIRVTPSTSALILGKAVEGDSLQILGETAEYDGFIWLQITTNDSRQITGWVASQYLEPCPSPAQPI